MSLLGIVKGKGPSGFGYGSSATDVTEGLDLSGKVALITGCNSGIGQETMRVLQARGAHVIGLARTEQKAREAGADTAVACELSEPASVRAAVETVRQKAPIDALVANAGIMALPQLQLKHGFELQFLTNHVGHFLLVTGLLGRLTEDARVVILSSSAHRMAPPEGIPFDNLDGSKGYRDWTFYGISKLSNLLFARELDRRLEGHRVANAVHPGVIRTNLSRHMPGWQQLAFGLAGPIALKSVGEGAATQTWAAVHPDTAAVHGEYLQDCNVGVSTDQGRDAGLAGELWETTEGILSTL
jgi:NAD(P)-dependent dehydrogenase (short-subunit alcohol dehydrogenase family)